MCISNLVTPPSSPLTSKSFSIQIAVQTISRQLGSAMSVVIRELCSDELIICTSKAVHYPFPFLVSFTLLSPTCSPPVRIQRERQGTSDQLHSSLPSVHSHAPARSRTHLLTNVHIIGSGGRQWIQYYFLVCQSRGAN